MRWATADKPAARATQSGRGHGTLPLLGVPDQTQEGFFQRQGERGEFEQSPPLLDAQGSDGLAAVDLSPGLDDVSPLRLWEHAQDARHRRKSRSYAVRWAAQAQRERLVASADEG